MTDNEIIKALYCCNNGLCDRCPYYGREDIADCREQSGADQLDLINRQQAKIERLKADITRVCAERDARIFTNNFIQAKAIKEFAESLKARVIYIPWCDYPPIHREIDNLVKEMVGEDNAAD